MKKLITVACALAMAACAFAVEAPVLKGLWSAGPIAASYDADGDKLGVEKNIGGITGGKNIKVVNKGGPKSGIGNTTTGYVQVSNGAAGSLTFTAPAGTSKITICAKAVSGKAFIVKADKDILLKANGCCKSDDYEDHVIEKKFAEDTVITISGFGGANCNLKAILVE